MSWWLVYALLAQEIQNQYLMASCPSLTESCIIQLVVVCRRKVGGLRRKAVDAFKNKCSIISLHKALLLFKDIRSLQINAFCMCSLSCVVELAPSNIISQKHNGLSYYWEPRHCAIHVSSYSTRGACNEAKTDAYPVPDVPKQRRTRRWEGQLLVSHCGGAGRFRAEHVTKRYREARPTTAFFLYRQLQISQNIVS